MQRNSADKAKREVEGKLKDVEMKYKVALIKLDWIDEDTAQYQEQSVRFVDLLNGFEN